MPQGPRGHECLLRVVSTRRRTAASGKRNFNDNFPATNSKRRQSHSDPQETFAVSVTLRQVSDLIRQSNRQRLIAPNPCMIDCGRMRSNIAAGVPAHTHLLKDCGACLTLHFEPYHHLGFQVATFGAHPRTRLARSTHGLRAIWITLRCACGLRYCKRTTNRSP